MPAYERPVGQHGPSDPIFLRVYGSHMQYICSGWPDMYGKQYMERFKDKLYSVFPEPRIPRILEQATHTPTWAVKTGDYELMLTDEEGQPTENPQARKFHKEDVIKITWIDLNGDPFP